MFVPNGKVTITQVLLPVSLVSFVLCIMLFFQTTQIILARQDLAQGQAQQQKPLEEAQLVKAQLEALAVGTAKLADKGNKDAKAIIDRMKKLGISVNPNAGASIAPRAGARAPGKMPMAPPAPPAEAPPPSLEPPPDR